MRKEIRSLSKDELESYFSALRKWQNGQVPSHVSAFPNQATFIALHAASVNYHDVHGNQDRMHFGGHFIIFHALMMLEFEKALQYYDPNVAAHYWDWSYSPKEIFNANYVGENDENGTIINGYLKDWPIALIGQVIDEVAVESLMDWRTNPAPTNTSGNYCIDPLEMDASTLLRGRDSTPNGSTILGRIVDLGDNVIPEPASSEQVTLCLNKPTFKEHWCCIFYNDGANPDCDVSKDSESNLHGLVHLWSGGYQSVSQPYKFDGADLSTSPNDPIWFLHHSQGPITFIHLCSALCANSLTSYSS